MRAAAAGGQREGHLKSARCVFPSFLVLSGAKGRLSILACSVLTKRNFQSTSAIVPSQSVTQGATAACACSGQSQMYRRRRARPQCHPAQRAPPDVGRPSASPTLTRSSDPGRSTRSRPRAHGASIVKSTSARFCLSVSFIRKTLSATHLPSHLSRPAPSDSMAPEPPALRNRAT